MTLTSCPSQTCASFDASVSVQDSFEFFLWIPCKEQQAFLSKMSPKQRAILGTVPLMILTFLPFGACSMVSLYCLMSWAFSWSASISALVRGMRQSKMQHRTTTEMVQISYSFFLSLENNNNQQLPLLDTVLTWASFLFPAWGKCEKNKKPFRVKSN